MKKKIKEIYLKIRLTIIKSPGMVLMLHSVNAKTNEETGVNLSREKFVDILDVVGGFEHIENVVEGFETGIVLSFDDGRSDIYYEIYPYLKKRNIPFTIFVTYNLLDTDGYLTKQQLVELSCDELVTIGSHCLNHVALAQQTKAVQYDEIMESKRLLEELIQRPVEYLAYPWGQYNEDTISVLKKTNAYKYAFVAGGYFFGRKEKSPFKLTRMNMSNKHYARNIKLLQQMKRKTISVNKEED